MVIVAGYSSVSSLIELQVNEVEEGTDDEGHHFGGLTGAIQKYHRYQYFSVLLPDRNRAKLL